LQAKALKRLLSLWHILCVCYGFDLLPFSASELMNSYLIELFLQLPVYVDDIQLQVSFLCDFICYWSCFIESSFYCLIYLFVSDLRFVRNWSVDVESFGGSLSHEEERYVGNCTIIYKILKWVWPEKNRQSS
jgi:hypothetical protein